MLRKVAAVVVLFGSVCASAATGTLENPPVGSSQSGIGLISGWHCNALRIDVEVDGGVLRSAAGYGTARADTATACGGRTSTGFGLLINYNSLGPGMHTVRALADGTEFASATFSVK